MFPLVISLIETSQVDLKDDPIQQVGEPMLEVRENNAPLIEERKPSPINEEVPLKRSQRAC